VGYVFVGGSRGNTESTPDVVPDDAFRCPPHGAYVRIEGSPASELYLLRDDGRAHYQVTAAPRPWVRDGDPCPACAGRGTELLATCDVPGGAFPTVGTASYPAGGDRYALVQCRDCMLPHWVAVPESVRPVAAPSRVGENG